MTSVFKSFSLVIRLKYLQIIEKVLLFSVWKSSSHFFLNYHSSIKISSINVQEHIAQLPGSSYTGTPPLARVIRLDTTSISFTGGKIPCGIGLSCTAMQKRRKRRRRRSRKWEACMQRKDTEGLFIDLWERRCWLGGWWNVGKWMELFLRLFVAYV